MSKAGQGTLTGISDQADVALLYLLQVCNRPDFRRVIVEGKEWEDFTIVFDDHNEDYEVKSYRREISYRDIRTIVIKELRKQLEEKDILKIVVRKLGKRFKNDYESVHNGLMYWIPLKYAVISPVLQRFSKKGWSKYEVFFLSKVEIVEFEGIDNIHQQVSEHFAFKHPFYFDHEDQRSIICRFFKDIMNKGRCGGFITQEDFLDKLTTFEKHVASPPTQFSPTLSVGRKILNLKNDFLSSTTKLQNLNQKTYLSQLTAYPSLIFYLSDELQKRPFHVNDFRFFLEKILLKKDYVRLALRLLKKKWTESKVDDDYFLDFITENYKRLLHHLNYDDALGILKEITKKDIRGTFEKKIYDFLEKEIFIPFREKKRQLSKKRRGWKEDKIVADILEMFYQRVKSKRGFIDFLFKYFDFTRDDCRNVTETHPKIYKIVKEFVALDLNTNFPYVVQKITSQFNHNYKGKYKGYEWSGSGVSQVGSSYFITDRGVVRLLFEPLFSEMYKADPKGAWEFFKRKILEKARTSATRESPVYLKRALVPILLGCLDNEDADKQNKKEALLYLENILLIKKGIPNTSEIIFDGLRRRDLKRIGLSNVMRLIEIDSIKYKRDDNPAGYPTNLFAVDTLCTLIRSNYLPAKNFFINLLDKPEFIRRDELYDSFELLVAQGIPQSDPDFIVEIFRRFNFEKYLNKLESDTVWDKSGLIAGLIVRDWQDGTNKGEKIVDALLRNRTPSKKVLDFLAGSMRVLSEKDALNTYRLFSRYLKDTLLFRNTFKNNDYIRQNIVWLAEELAKKKHYDEAKTIIDLCIDDPDPQTNDREGDFNYHVQVKQGEERIGISTVRGTVAWVLRQFAANNDPRLMEYALQKTRILLDLDGELAGKLGYAEPDLYVRVQALYPLLELAHTWRRKELNGYKPGLGDSVKTLAFEVVETTDRQCKSKETRPKALLRPLASVFSNIRDLTADEAGRIVRFFEDYEVTEAHVLFIYFAEFDQDKSFNSTFFKKKLREMCKNKNSFKANFSGQFRIIVDDDNKKKTKNFERIEQYWKLLFEEYQQEVFDDLYRTLEITLTWPKKYRAHKELLKKALKREIAYFKNKKVAVQLWDPGTEIFHTLKEHSDDDFLEVFSFLAKNLNENIHYFHMKDWIAIFRSIKPRTNGQKSLYAEVELLLKDLYAEYLEN